MPMHGAGFLLLPVSTLTVQLCGAIWELISAGELDRAFKWVLHQRQ